MRTTRVAAGVAVAAVSLLATAPAQAWPVPSTLATGGACTGSVRTPITWSITNLETEFPRSPARIENVTVTPSYPVPAFLPVSLPNIGTATATGTTPVPPTYSGTVTLAYRLVWEGLDGSDQRDGEVTIQVQACPQPPPTTTTTTQPTGFQSEPPPTTTTTTIPTTTTTVATEVSGVSVEAVEAIEAVEAVEPDFESIAVRPVAVQAQPLYTG